MTKSERQKALKLAAEKYFYWTPHQLSIPKAFIAGAKWALRKKKGKKK